MPALPADGYRPMNLQLFRDQIPHALRESNIPRLPEPYRGKVRDVYELPQRDALLFVTTDRISAFDVVLGTVPFKGELLTSLATSWFDRTKDLCPNHLLDHPDPSAMVVRKLRGVPVEVVLRGRLTGSLWRDYRSGKNATAYGITLPEGLTEGHEFETPLLTPTTKAAVGEHDLPISETEILERRLVEPGVWDQIKEYSLALFRAGQDWARSRGLELVDTKYEFGLDASGKIFVMDEIHTADSSRYWRLTPEGPRALDKEFLRQWLLEQGYSGDGTPPEIPEDVLVELAARYAELFTILEGREPELQPGNVASRLDENLRRAGI